MTYRIAILSTLAAFLTLAGCGASTQEHVEQPMTKPPAPGSSPFDKLTTADAKIQYIQNSNAPKAEKDRAVEMVKSGKM